MEYHYKRTDEGEVIFRVEDGLFIPQEVHNRHYKQYLAWLAEGNKPTAAEEEEI